MTTQNRLDLTDPSARKALHGFVASNEAFAVYVLHTDGYLVHAFTARYEQQKNRPSWRWHAYKRAGGKLKKVYVGRSSDLTVERLQAIADRLATSAVTVP